MVNIVSFFLVIVSQMGAKRVENLRNKPRHSTAHGYRDELFPRRNDYAVPFAFVQMHQNGEPMPCPYCGAPFVRFRSTLAICPTKIFLQNKHLETIQSDRYSDLHVDGLGLCPWRILGYQGFRLHQMETGTEAMHSLLLAVFSQLFRQSV